LEFFGDSCGAGSFGAGSADAELDRFVHHVVGDAHGSAERVLVELTSPDVPLTRLVRSIVECRRRGVEFGGGASGTVVVVEQLPRAGVVVEVLVVVLRPGEVPLGALLQLLRLAG